MGERLICRLRSRTAHAFRLWLGRSHSWLSEPRAIIWLMELSIGQQLALAFHGWVRSEVEKRIANRISIQRWYLLALGAVAIASVAGGSRIGHGLPIWIPLLLVPPAGLVAAAMFSHETRLIARLSRYVNDCLTPCYADPRKSPLPWESWNHPIADLAPLQLVEQADSNIRDQQAASPQEGTLRKRFEVQHADMHGVRVFMGTPGTWGTWLLLAGPQLLALTGVFAIHGLGAIWHDGFLAISATFAAPIFVFVTLRTLGRELEYRLGATALALGISIPPSAVDG